jgi:hypothetical protein
MSSRITETIRTLDQKDVISLWHCGLGDEDAAALADALNVNTSVTTIWLDGNLISNEGAAVLADALNVNSSVTFINLEDNQIGNEGALALADALKVNISVTLINLGGNQLGDKGATALANALKSNTSVTTTRIDGNQINESNLATVRELTDRKKRLRHLFLYDARRMLLSLMCADECGVVWPYLLGSDNIRDGVAVPTNNIVALRATLVSIVAERQRRLQYTAI